MSSKYVVYLHTSAGQGCVRIRFEFFFRESPLLFFAPWPIRLWPLLFVLVLFSSVSLSACFCLCRTEQREVRAQPAALVSVGSLHAALRWPSDGLEPPDSSLPAVPTAWLGLEAPTGT